MYVKNLRKSFEYMPWENLISKPGSSGAGSEPAAALAWALNRHVLPVPLIMSFADL